MLYLESQNIDFLINEKNNSIAITQFILPRPPTISFIFIQQFRKLGSDRSINNADTNCLKDAATVPQ